MPFRTISLGPKLMAGLMVLSLPLFFSCNNKSLAQTEREKRMENSSQYSEGKFKNPVHAPVMKSGSTWAYIKKSWFGHRVDPHPRGELPITPIQSNDWTNLDKEPLSFAWLGHSSILMAVDGKTILVDPVLEERASPFKWLGPKRFHPAPVTIQQLPFIDVVLITHDHYDHLEEASIRQLAPKTGLFLVPLGIGELLEKWGVAPEKIVELDWWEEHRQGTLKFTATPAVHYARRWLFDGDQRLWCSWSIQGETQKLFVSGDSGYFDGFKKIGDTLGPFDVTFLKIGSYDELWKQIHMTPEESVQQHLDLGGTLLVPLHWATFDLALHPWYEPIERMVQSAPGKGVQFITPGIGQQIHVNQLPKENFWWRTLDKQ